MTAKDTDQQPPEAPASQGGYHVTEQVGHLLRKAYQRHLSIFQTNASDPDLTSVQFVTLCALHDLGPSSQVELVKATSVDQATIRGIVDRLKVRGLVNLSKDEADPQGSDLPAAQGRDLAAGDVSPRLPYQRRNRGAVEPCGAGCPALSVAQDCR